MVPRPKLLECVIVARPKYLSSCSIHFHSLRDLSCKKLKEKGREEAMKGKKRKVKETCIRMQKDEILKMKLIL
jgi:hypothetical protein